MIVDDGLRILLVEDNPGDARLIEEMLQETAVPLASAERGRDRRSDVDCGTEAVEVLRADRLETGLERLAASSVDIVLLDLGLPDSSGLDTLTTVLERSAAVPIVVLTGLSDERVGVRAVQQGAQAYLVKDEITSELLTRSLRHALERHQRETQLTALSTVSRELMSMTSFDDIAERAVTSAAESLDFPVAAICLYDTDRGELRPRAATDRAEELLFTEEPIDDAAEVSTRLSASCTEIVERVFATNQVDVATADDARSSLSDTDSPLRSRLTFPLGTHGVFLVGSTNALTIPSIGVDYATILATNTEAALDRLSREQRLQEREAELETQTESLERLNRINAMIRDVVQSVVHATTRTEIEQAVCDQLAAADSFRFAWIGAHDSLSGTVTPNARSGVGNGYLDSVPFTTDGDSAECGPVEAAVRTRELQIVEDVVQTLSSASRREEAMKRGYRSIASIPLVYAETLYGILTVYADRPGIFTERVQSVLTELGETIAHAINAVESKRALISDRVVELKFEVQDADIVFLELTAETGCECTLESVVPRMDDRLRVFFSTSGAAVDEVAEFAERALGIEEFTLVAERAADCVFECTLREPNVVSFCLTQGVTVQTLTAADGAGQLTVELSSDADVRGFAERFQSAYPATSLVASREDERSVQTRQAFQTTLGDRLTDRQAEVLRTAFFSGYFESPRASSGRDVAATLDISQPTFNHHLRAALRKLLTLLYTD
ncbi:response regulator receiver modulated GAF sensor protein [Haloterrigena turkmenica DSM 5511]|uniref:Response regulator receiver modulated GAF sensor protein n=1 Tax=Haloterrigena turkmenica (strain ATCC 51198 / DSM 5511 / JCM 9101 / NCIMB 13204 / VKM B-1734 / 4k) TaxID=543526 RepID=D2RTI6_HALTV|nr:bacterio-opsin activator domain-containing protein [Haloterrigena turkmenica]ADB59029.1 response regulator receiver modulated GAF sensor protein [Haloterrigena turkmenica DSM 5511]